MEGAAAMWRMWTMGIAISTMVGTIMVSVALSATIGALVAILFTPAVDKLVAWLDARDAKKYAENERVRQNGKQRMYELGQFYLGSDRNLPVVIGNRRAS